MADIVSSTIDSNPSEEDFNAVLENLAAGRPGVAAPHLAGKSLQVVGSGEDILVTDDGMQYVTPNGVFEFDEIEINPEIDPRDLNISEKTNPGSSGTDNDKSVDSGVQEVGANNQNIIINDKTVNTPLYAVTLRTIGTHVSMYKLRLEGALKEELEIRPNIKKTPNERPFLIQMVDSNLRTHGIVIDDILISSIKLNPNPTTLTINSSKIINRYHTMTRWVEEHWGDEIDTITFSGSTFSFFARPAEGHQGSGLALRDRQNTKPYILMKELVKIFRYNGTIYQDASTYNQSDATQRFLQYPGISKNFLLNHPRKGMIKERLYVNIFFDYVSFVGYFETFDIIEDAKNPYQFTYNAIFKAERTKYYQGTNAIDLIPANNANDDALPSSDYAINSDPVIESDLLPA